MKIARRWNPGLIPLGFGPLVAVLAYLETHLDPFFGEASTVTWTSSVVLGLGIVLTCWYPLTGLAIAALCFPVGVIFYDAPGAGGAAMIGLVGIVCWVGWREPPRRSVIGLGIVASVLPATSLATGQSLWELFFIPVILLPGWYMGLVARRNGERAARIAELAAALDAEREQSEQAAVARERTRIAREVHDAVAHSVSVMTLQLGALRRQLADRPVEQELVLGLERLGRQTVEEMRGLVGILRDRLDGAPSAPVPSLRRVDELIADVQAAGLPVTCTTRGELPELPPVLDLSAYRVLQEALTNVLRHAGPAPTVVTLEQTDQALVLEVVNEPGTAKPALTSSGGHGLVGMRERLSMVHGTLAAGPESGGGFAVRARFPLPRKW